MIKFSIVIPVLNGEKYIGLCIDNIRKMEIENIELNLIVVDNGSTDSTISILESKNINYIIRKDINISSLRNIGANLSSGEFIGFVDSDCLVDKHWMLGAINILNTNSSIGIVGRYYDVCDNPTWLEHAWCERRKSLDGPVKFLPAGNMVVRKSLFDELGGFSKDIVTGEDYEFCQRVRKSGYIVINSSKVNVKHLGNVKKLLDVIKKERWYGLGMFSTLKNENVSMPLIACILFIILSVLFIVSIFLNKYCSLIMLIGLAALMIFVSLHFTKYIKDKKITMLLKFLPISLCYLIGRSLSLIDLILKKVIR